VGEMRLGRPHRSYSVAEVVHPSGATHNGCTDTPRDHHLLSRRPHFICGRSSMYNRCKRPSGNAKVHSSPKGCSIHRSADPEDGGMEAFFALHNRTPARDQPKLLTHVGHGSFTLLKSDKPLGHQASADIARTTIRRITRAPSLGRHMLTTMHQCPQCGVNAGEEESLERHVVRWPNGGMLHLFHAGMVGVIGSA
jgi:hypothetical protein